MISVFPKLEMLYLISQVRAKVGGIDATNFGFLR